MSTGYTQIIQNSKETDSDKLFQQFALQCARAFGALASMWDDKWDAEIPDKIIPSNYHKDKIQKHKVELAKARKTSAAEWEKLSSEDYNKKYNYYREEITKAADLRAKYQAVLDKVQNYNPPTSDHQNYKNFMVEQIKGSIDFDCSEDYYNKQLQNLKRLSGKEFKIQTINNIVESLKYDQEQYKKEQKSAKQRTLWIKNLKKSLGIKPNKIKLQG